MKRLGIVLIYAASVLMCPFAGGADDSPEISDVSDLNRVIWDMAMKREERRILTWTGTVDNKSIESLVGSSVVLDCADRWYYRYQRRGQEVEFTLELKESMYILAAYLDPRLVNRLNPVERRALKMMQRRIERLELKRLPRKLRIIRFMNDLALNYQCSHGRDGHNKSRNAFAISLDRYAGSRNMMEEYIQVMMGALAIPCRSESGSGKCVQLEDGKWYLLNRRYPYFTECSKSDDEEVPARATRDETPDNSPVDEYEVYTSAKAFWKAAEKASKAGDESLEGFVKNYPGSRPFMKAYERHVADGGTVTVSDKFLPARNGEYIYVSVTFNHDDEEPDDGTESSSTKKSSILDEDQDGKKRFKKLSR